MSAKELIEEAKRQSEALKTISKWRAAGFVLAAAGAALLYGGLHRSTLRIPFLAAGGIMAAAVISGSGTAAKISSIFWKLQNAAGAGKRLGESICWRLL